MRGCEVVLLVGLEGMTYDEAAVILKGITDQMAFIPAELRR